jgi:lipopolysaccharide biosynthesis protein
VLERADPAAAEVYAITDSWEKRFHLQSYFMLFHKPVLLNEKFSQFWRRMPYVNNKHYVVKHYEVGLTKLLLNLGFRCTALFPYEVAARSAMARLKRLDPTEAPFTKLPRVDRDMLEFLRDTLASGRPINGSHFLWDHMLIQMRCPFIKRELLAQNPMGVPGLLHWREVVSENSEYDPDLIREHLQVISRGQTS